MASNCIRCLGGLVAVAALLGGCVAETPVSVAPGQGKSFANLQRDDAACRPTAPAAATTATTPAAAAPTDNYYQCMAAKGEFVVTNRAAAYPVYAAYPYYGYPYAYPYGYPYYGYPYPAAYFGPFVGVGVGFGFGGYDRGGFYRGGYFRGGDFHGGGGGFHR